MQTHRIHIVGREGAATRTVEAGLEAYEAKRVSSVAGLAPAAVDAVVVVVSALGVPLETAVREVRRIHGTTPLVIASDRVPDPSADAVAPVDSAAVDHAVEQVLTEASIERARRRRRWTEMVLTTVDEATPEVVCKQLVQSDVYETAWVVEREGEELTPTASAGIPTAALRSVPITSDVAWARALRSEETVIEAEPPVVAVPVGERSIVCTDLNPIDPMAVEPLERYLSEPSMERTDEQPKYTLFGKAVTHEINNHLDLAMLHIESADGDEHLDHVETALERIAAVTDEVGALVGRELSVEAQTLATVAAEAWDGVSVPESDLKVESGTVEADERLLRLMLSNLFRNAIEHGGEDVTVTAGPLGEGGFYVEDDGPGFPENNEEPFEWGWSGGDGMGIGLGLVSLVAERHDWSITARSDDGARVEFRP